MPNKYSPNWFWSELGYTVNRCGFLRTITDSKGNAVCKKASYETELSISSWLYFGTDVKSI